MSHRDTCVILFLCCESPRAPSLVPFDFTLHVLREKMGSFSSLALSHTTPDSATRTGTRHPSLVGRMDKEVTGKGTQAHPAYAQSYHQKQQVSYLCDCLSAQEYWDRQASLPIYSLPSIKCWVKSCPKPTALNVGSASPLYVKQFCVHTLTFHVLLFQF